MKKVTVIIPCYNGEKFVAKCIESILNQTKAPNEILVIDDGSTDNSASIIEKYNVRLIKHETNKGLAEARNTGMKNASSDILIFVDADTIADPKLIESLLEGYTNENVAGVGGQGIESSIQNMYDLWRKLHASQSSGDKVIKNTQLLWGLCSSFKRNVLIKLGGFDPFYETNGEDMDISIRIRKKGYRLAYMPNARVYHQRTDNFKTLCNMIYRWYYWGYIVKKRNGEEPFKKWLFITFRNLRTNTLSDLIHQKNFKLVLINLVMFLIELKATIFGARARISYARAVSLR